MGCKDWKRVEALLDGGDDAAAREHLALCRSCRRRARRLEVLDLHLASGLAAAASSSPRPASTARLASTALPDRLRARLLALPAKARDAARSEGGSARSLEGGREQGPCPRRDALERALDGAGPDDVLAHIERCARCQRRAQQTELLDAALASGLAAPEALRPAFLDKLRALGPAAPAAPQAHEPAGRSSRQPREARAGDGAPGRSHRRKAATPASGTPLARPAPPAPAIPARTSAQSPAALEATSARSPATPKDAREGGATGPTSDRQRSLRLAPRRAPEPRRWALIAAAAAFVASAFAAVGLVRRGLDDERGALARRGESRPAGDASGAPADRGSSEVAPAGAGEREPAPGATASVEPSPAEPMEGHDALLAGADASEHEPRDGGAAGRDPAQGALRERAGGASGSDGEATGVAGGDGEGAPLLAGGPDAGPRREGAGAGAEPRPAAPRPARRPGGGILLPGEEDEPAHPGTRAPAEPGDGPGGEAGELERLANVEEGLRLAHVRGRLLVRRAGAEPAPLPSAIVFATDELIAGRGGAAVALGGAAEVASAEGARFGLSRDRERRGTHLAVHEGALLCTTTAEAPAGALFVHTPAGEVEAHGARLFVEGSGAGEAARARVDVLEGEVTVRGRGRSERVAAGQQVLLSATRDPAIAPLAAGPSERRAHAALAALLPERRVAVRLDFERGPGFFTRHPVVALGEGRGHALQAKPLVGDPQWGYMASGKRHLSAQPGTLLRFRYHTTSPRPILVRGWSQRHGASFYTIEPAPIVGRWATFEVAVSSFCHYSEEGVHPDPEVVLSTLQILTGTPEDGTVFLIDDLEIIDLR